MRKHQPYNCDLLCLLATAMKHKKTTTSKSPPQQEKVEESDDVPQYAKTYLLPRKVSLAHIAPPSSSLQFDPSLMKEETGLTTERMSSLVPCVGTERLREYVEFIKEGNFYPLNVLDPELGIQLNLLHISSPVFALKVSTMRSLPKLKVRGSRVRIRRRKRRTD